MVATTSAWSLLAFEPDGSEVRVRRVEDDPAQLVSDVKSLRGIWSDTPGDGSGELLEERCRERELEERKAKSRAL